MAAQGDPLAVARQQIHAETIRHEVKHLMKNRTEDFVMNPHKCKWLPFKPSWPFCNWFCFFQWSIFPINQTTWTRLTSPRWRKSREMLTQMRSHTTRRKSRESSRMQPWREGYSPAMLIQGNVTSGVPPLLQRSAGMLKTSYQRVQPWHTVSNRHQSLHMVQSMYYLNTRVHSVGRYISTGIWSYQRDQCHELITHTKTERTIQIIIFI